MATMTTHAALNEAGAGQPWRGDDFPDWLSPMLVRELRQGIQSGAFFWTFLLLQAALVLHAAFTVLGASDRFDRDLIRTSGGFFWTILVVTVGLVIPLRGLQAVAHERVGNNLDLVRLTRLSATRIVVGKWAALVAQVLLVTAAILPYLVLRYFMGGVNVVEELSRLGWLVVAAAVVAALAVYASTRPQRERVGLMALLGLGGWGTLMGLVARGSLPTLVGGWSGLGVAAVYGTLFLDAAAASIAPAPVFPLPLLLLLPRLKERQPLYVAVQAVCLVIFGADAFLRGMPGSRHDTLGLVAPFPLAGLLRLFADGTAATTLFLAGLVVLALILAIIARPWWREMRETWRLVGPETRP